MTSAVVAVAGLCCLVVAGFLVALPVGFAVLGASLLLAGLFVDFEDAP